MPTFKLYKNGKKVRLTLSPLSPSSSVPLYSSSCLSSSHYLSLLLCPLSLAHMCTYTHSQVDEVVGASESKIKEKIEKNI